jgi:hypothetical protein
MRHSRFMLGLVVALALALGATLWSSGTAHAANNAFVRVVHAAPAAPDVDVYVDGSKLLTSFKFGTVTDYVPLAAGSHEIAVVPAGKSLSDAVIKQSVSVSAGVSYTVAAIGDSNTSPALVAFVDDNSVASGMAKVRVYHLSSDAGPVSVATGGQTVIPDLTFKNASDYLSVQPGSYTFDVTVKDSGTTVNTSADLAADTVTSVFAVGLLKGSGDTAFKFVAASVSATPSGLPSTGFAPDSAQGASAPVALYAGLVVAILLLGGAGYALSRRRTG